MVGCLTFFNQQVFAFLYYSGALSFDIDNHDPDATKLDVTVVRRKGRTEVVRLVARLLARLHEEGICLLDTKPENFLIDETGGVWLLDLEQARESCNPRSKAWDISLFLHYLLRGFPSNELVNEILDAFSEEYLSSGGSVSTIKNALSPTLSLPFFLLLSPPSLLNFRVKSASIVRGLRY